MSDNTQAEQSQQQENTIVPPESTNAAQVEAPGDHENVDNKDNSNNNNNNDETNNLNQQQRPTRNSRQNRVPKAVANRRRNDREKSDMDAIHPKSLVGQLAKSKKIDLSRVFMDSLPLRENFIAKVMLGEDYQEVKIASKSVQKQTRSGQKTRNKAVVAIGNRNGYIGLGVSIAKDHPAAKKQAAAQARTNVIPVRLGYWGDAKNENKMHTLPFKVTGKSGSVRVKLIPAPMGRGIVANKTCTDILKLAGITNCFVVSKGHTSTKENHAKATLDALSKTYKFYPQQDWNNYNNHRSLADESNALNLKQLNIR